MDNVDESFVKVGTALPPLSSNKADKNEFVPIWQQEVKDEKGRRRLHGAFTGGFSAGYFNTVGSKEGWAPAEFKSSRSDKKNTDPKRKRNEVSRPEDFMDDEDLAELESRKELKTNSQFDSTIGPRGSTSTFIPPQYDPLSGDVGMGAESGSFDQLVGPSRAAAALSDLIQPSTSRVGQKLMQKMGWRLGQGIGPRITFERKTRLGRTLGLQMNPTDDDDDTERRNHLFAPLDRPLMVFPPWSGRSGLAYVKSIHSLELDRSFSRAGLPVKSDTGVDIAGQAMPKGASFGLGALNDVEEDDRDIYDSGTNLLSSDSRARRLMVLEEESNTHQPFKSLLRQPPSRKHKVPSSQTTFSDGTSVPKNFRLAAIGAKQPPIGRDIWYKAPVVPDEWEPNPSKLWAKRTNRPTEVASQMPSSGMSSKPLTAGDRGRLLGEKQPVKSVFDFLSAKDKMRLEKIRQFGPPSGESESALNAGQTLSPMGPPVTVPTLPPTIAQAALRGFMPFAHDSSKQQRYRLYLQSQAGMLSEGVVFSPKPKPGESLEQLNKELDGFAKSAMMFKPMSSMMASRFTSATSSAASGELATPEPGLRQPVFQDEKLPDDKSDIMPPTSTKVEEQLSQPAQAVRMDMFGLMTRSTEPFYPHKLLCKRLNVPNPFPHGESIEAKTKVTSNRMSDFLTAHGFQPATIELEKAEPDNEEKSEEWITKKVSNGPIKPLDQVGLGDDDNQGRDILTTTRPAIDLFKAIFADDSEDDMLPEDKESSPPACKDTAQDVVPSTSDIPPVAFGRESEKPTAGTSSSARSSNVQIASVSEVPSHTPTVVDPEELRKLASFRPTFLHKTDKPNAASIEKDEGSTISKKKKSKKRSAMLSFEDEGAEPSRDEPKVKKKKSRISHGDKESSSLKHTRKVEEVLVSGPGKDMDDEWVEKTVTSPLRLPNKTHADPDRQSKAAVGGASIEHGNRRLRASDLMDD